MNMVCDCINQITCDPACFDATVPEFVKTLKNYCLSDEVISSIVDKIYEMVSALLQSFVLVFCSGWHALFSVTLFFAVFVT